MVSEPPAPNTGPPARLRLLHVGTDRALVTAVVDYLGREYDVRVENVRTGDAALQQLGDSVDCVLAAQALPEGTGLDLLDAVSESRPGLPFVLYAPDWSEEQAGVADAASATRYVQKPTDEPGRSSLADCVADAVRDAGSPDLTGDPDERDVPEDTERHRTTEDAGGHDATGDAEGHDATKDVENPDATGNATGSDAIETATYRSFLDDVLGGADGASVVTDADGTVVWVDNTAVNYFGLDPEEAIGTRRRQFVRDQLAPTVADRSKFTACALDDRSGDGADEFRCFVTSGPDRTSRWLNRRCHRLDDGPYAGGRVEQFTDVSDLVRTEAALVDLQRLMTTDEPFAERLDGILGLGTERLDLPYGFVTAVEDRIQTVVTAVGDHPRLSAGVSCPLDETYCRRTLAADDLVAVDDALEAGWGDDPAYEAFGLESYIGVPIGIDGGCYGTFCFASSRPRATFDDHEELFVEMAATWAGYELDRIEAADA